VADPPTPHPHLVYVTHHSPPLVLHAGNVDVYLCGPPPMVDAVQKYFKAEGLAPASFHYEKFTPNQTTVAA
jgi:benzoate/toluate 1,2-dioxygenase reductase subunit